MPAEPPAHLSPPMTAFWNAVVDHYVLDDPPALELLRRACEASDRADQAREVIDREGPTIVTRHGEVKVHPAVAVERDARTAVRQFLRELRITDPPAEDRHASRLGGTR